MLTVSGRGGPAVASAVRAVTQAVGARTIQPTPAGSQLLSHWEEREEITPPIIPYEYQWLATHVDAPSRPRPQTSYAIGKSLFTRQLTAGTGVGVGTHVRYYHNDIKVPNFENYRHPKTKDPNRAAKESRDERRLTLDAVKIGVGVTGAIVAKRIGQVLVANLSPAQSTLAMGVIDIDLSAVPEGKSILVKWNGKPVLIRHRTAEEVKKERAQAKDELRDPQTDEERAYAHPSGKWLVVMANCTHLGCIPIANQGNWGGFYCPCHGSHYDASGRIRKGPAPLNLEVPDHHVLEAENKLILGLKTPAL